MMSCILLAAGESRRFGSPKALASIDGTPAIVRIQQALIASSIDEIIVVLGADAGSISLEALKHKKVRIVHNKDYKLGQTASFQCGLRAVDASTDGVALWPVDYPFVRLETVDILAGAFRDSTRTQIVIPAYKQVRGHPPIFPVALKEECLRLSVKEGLNALAHRHAAITVTYPVQDSGVVQTFNTPEEFAALSPPAPPEEQ